MTMSTESVALAEAITQGLLGQLEERESRIQSQVMEQVEARIGQLGIADAVAEMRAVRDQITTRPGTNIDGQDRENGILASIDPTRYNPLALGAQLDSEFSSFGDFLRAVAGTFSRGGTRDPRVRFVGEDGALRADMGTGSLGNGGALVPEQFRSQLLRLSLQATSIRPRTMQIPMSSARIRIPKIRETSHASTVFGGVRAYWTRPGAGITESNPETANVVLEANGLKILTDVENELLGDSFMSFEALLVQLWREAIPWYEEMAFMRGTGVGEPKGILESEALVSITRAGAGAVAIADVAKVEARLLPGSSGRAVWMAHPSVLASLIPMTNGSVQAWMTDFSQPIPRMFMGRPLIVNEHCSPLGTVGDLMLVDWMYYLLGDRQALSIDSSPHAKFENDITVFRGVERLDGQPWLDSAITPAQGSDTLSPFVAIAS